MVHAKQGSSIFKRRTVDLLQRSKELVEVAKEQVATSKQLQRECQESMEQLKRLKTDKGAVTRPL